MLFESINFSILFQRSYTNDHRGTFTLEGSIDITSNIRSGHNDLYSLASKLVNDPLINKIKNRVAEINCTCSRCYNWVYWNHETCLC
jgi:hypothetical protein